MLQDNQKPDRIIRAALTLIEENGWRELRLADIASKAELSLADLAEIFSSRQAILDAFIDAVDLEVLRRADTDPNEPARDRVFDVIMTRFEVLAPYRRAIRRIADDLAFQPRQTAQMLARSARSQTWMLRAAGIDVNGPTAGLRVSGLMTVYAQVLPIWLDDDDPGLARTMAALDRRLRRGERWLVRMEGLGGAMFRLAGAFVPRRRSSEAPSPPEPPSTPETSPPAQNGSAVH